MRGQGGQWGRGTMTKTTLKDIARRLGVSTATVSYALNGAPGVSAELRLSILQAARELNYQTNYAARSLARSRTNTVAWFRTTAQPPADPFSLSVFNLTAAALQRAGYDTLMHTIDLARGIRSAADLLASRRVDGAVLSVDLVREGVVELLGQGPPVVGLEVDSVQEGLPCVWPEYRRGVTALFDYLMERGYRRIGFLAADPLEPTAQQRLAGFRDGYERRGLRVDPGWIMGGSYDFDAAKSAARALLSGDARLDAVMAATDRMAVAAVQAAQELGLRVPEDLAVTGFDDSEYAVYVSPALTTVRLAPSDIARRLAATMLDWMERPGVAVGGRVAVPVTLVVRQSA